MALVVSGFEVSFIVPSLEVVEVSVVFIERRSLDDFILSQFIAECRLFVLVDEANILTAEIAFVSISYFNLMRMPLNQVPTYLLSSYLV